MSSDTQDLNDNMVKLVAYSIVSVRRGHERILEGGEGSIIVTSRMTRETFTAYIIGRYLQQEIRDDKEEVIRAIIGALDRYLRQASGDPRVKTTNEFARDLRRHLRGIIDERKRETGGDIKKKEAGAAPTDLFSSPPFAPAVREKIFRQVPEEDRKYLRVHYVVSNRWPREPRKFEEEQIDVLGEISQAIACK